MRRAVKIAVVILILLAGWLLTGCSSHGRICPKHEHWGVIIYIPQRIGNVTTMQPLWGCVSS